MKLLCINTAALGSKKHSFFFSLGADFLKEYSGGLVPEGTFNAEVALTKRSTLIEACFFITGNWQLVCDRSLKVFSYPIKVKKRMIFKYGEKIEELSDDVILIDWNTTNLEVGQLLYELIGLAVPMKKLHPDFQNENTDHLCDEMVYSTLSYDKDKINPVWQNLVLQHKH